ncbi:MAG TPA: TIR domain-containing protein [Candidatus Binatia bacterium]|jgi:WD40 repeat protein
MLYKAFISYSHAADGKLAPAVQRALHHIAKPWYQRRTMRVFRDQTNLATSPGLWTSIQSALEDAEFFLFMASPAAAESLWVQKEVEWWLKNRSWQKFLILLTDGNLSWDEAGRDVQWTATNALPKQLAGVFPEEPLYTDLRWAKNVDQLSLRHSQFRAGILELAATLLDRPKDELDGEDVRQHRRFTIIAWSAAATLVIFLIAAVLAAYLATQQSNLATSRALGARAEALLPTNPELALLLAREAVRFKPDDQAEYALRQAILRNPRRMIHQTSAGRTVVANFAGPNSVVAAEPGKKAVVWGAADGRRIGEIAVTVGDQLLLSRSPDHSLAVFQNDESMFTVYDSATWKPLRRMPGSQARFSRDGRSLTAVDGQTVRQWIIPSLESRNASIALPEGYVVRDVSRDGTLVFLAEDAEVSAALIVDANSGATVARIPKAVLRAGSAFSPDDRFVVTDSMDEAGFSLWEVRTGRRVRSFEKPGYGSLGWTTYVAFNPDGKTFVAGNRNGQLHLWNVETGEWKGVRDVHRNDIGKIEFSRDGRTMLTVAADGVACLWDTGSMRCLAALGGKGDDAWDIGFAPDSTRFFTTHMDGTVRIWHRDTWFPVLSFPGEKSVLSEDGHTVVSVSQGQPVRLFDAATGKIKTALEYSSGEVDAVALNERASLIAVAFSRGVQLWSAESGKRTVQLGKESAETIALAFNPDGSQVITGSEHGSVRFWSTGDGRLLNRWNASPNRIGGIAVHPDGERVVLAEWDQGATVRHAKSGAVLWQARLNEEGAVVQGVSLSPDGRLLMVLGDKFAHVWDLNSRKQVQILAGHTDETYSGAFSRDGRSMLTGSGYMHARGEPPEDGNEVRLWDANSGRYVMSYRSAGLPVDLVSFGSDGATIFAASRDGMIRRYQCELCLPRSRLIEIAAARSSRDLTASENASYIPENPLFGWLKIQTGSRQ